MCGGVVAHGMAFGLHAAQKLRMRVGLGSEHHEACMRVLGLEGIEHLGREFTGTVIVGDGNAVRTRRVRYGLGVLVALVVFVRAVLVVFGCRFVLVFRSGRLGA